MTYHSGHEWNRRITNQKNAALGYVKATESGCEVHFLRFWGLLCSLQFLLYLVLAELMLPFSEAVPELGLWASLALGFGITVSVALIFTLLECMTEESEEGRRTLLSFLLDPSDPYGSYSRTP